MGGLRVKNMHLFLRSALIYFAVAMLLALGVRQEANFTSLQLVYRLIGAVNIFAHGALILAGLFVLSRIMAPSWKETGRNIGKAALTLIGCLLFLGAFSSIKTTLPTLGDLMGLAAFFADPPLAEVDRLLAGGIDPWRLTHAVTNFLGWHEFALDAQVLYGVWWSVAALYLPAIMILIGDDEARVRHFVALYLFAWIVLGNVLALAGLSSGPIFYDSVFGTDRFADLHASLAVSGSYADSWFASIQPGLWDAYATKQQAVGTGISAFPSLHVAMTTVTALYLWERSRLLGAIGVLLVGAVLFTSVWVGYHYAVDGYFSIAAVLGLHWALKRRQWPLQAGGAGLAPARR